MSILRKIGLWLALAGSAIGGLLLYLWRRAVRQRDEARVERDLARRSAERERVLQDEHRQVEVAARRDIATAREALPVAEKVADEASRAAQSDPVKELNRRLAAKWGQK